MISKFYTAVQNLCGNGFCKYEKLEYETICDLTALKILETPTKLLPFLEDKDTTRSLITMLAKWLQTYDSDLRDEIMEELTKLATESFESEIEKEFELWHLNEERHAREAKRDREHLIYVDNRQRI